MPTYLPRRLCEDTRCRCPRSASWIRTGRIKARNIGTTRRPIYRVHVTEVRRLDAA